MCIRDSAQVVVDTMIASKDEALQEEARILLLNLGRGNPRFQVHVAESVLSLLSCSNSVAQRMGAQSTRQYMQTLPPGFDYVTSSIPMLESSDLQVQYEASELIRALSKYAYLHEAIVDNLVQVLEKPIPTKGDGANPKEDKEVEHQGRVVLRQYGAACKVLGMLASSHPALMPLMVSHGVMEYVCHALTTMDYECIQHASGAIASLCAESPEAESMCEQLLTEPLVYSVKQDHLRFYRELEPDIVAGIKLRTGHMIEARRDEKNILVAQNPSTQMDQLHQDLNISGLDLSLIHI
eukprot:TRINITY_DN26816_c0_g1_i1.p1 TRINITY_DN26816_c0_g1~~TRINITY_DN26816_c0_g1_i1.p1  ORF type:complete len:295 (-),score=55.95 TRINITY_DN26816_c0_g1_i1:112-996(-)